MTIGGSFSVDEIVYITAAKSIFSGHIFINLEHPPLGKYFIGLGLQIFGETSLGARAFSAIFGLATVYVTYRIGRELGGRVPSMLCAVLLSVTHIFYSYSGHAMLDMYLAFFATITLYFLLVSTSSKRGELRMRYGILLGIFSGLALMSKLYGIFFVASAYLLVLGLCGEYRLPSNTNRLRLFLSRNKVILISIGVFILTVLVIYSPYLSDPGRSLDLMYERNVSHLEEGHAQTVAWKTYDYPPFWTYLFWIYEMGAIYIIGLTGALFLFAYRALNKNISKKVKVISIYFIVPFVSLSVLTVKFPRYFIPLLPMLSIISIFALYQIIEGILQRTGSMGLNIPFIRRPTILSIVTIAVIFMLIPSPYYDLKDDPEIGMDSGYEKVADRVKDIHEMNAMEEMNVLCYYAQILKYYLEDDLDRINITYLRYYTSTEKELQGLKDGVFDLVVDYSYQSRFSGQEIYKFIRANSVKTIQLDRGLCIYVMKEMDT